MVDLHVPRERDAAGRQVGRPSVASALLARLDGRDDPNACWVWTGHCNPSGYGQIGVEGQTRLAHRVAYEAFVGAITDGLSVCHRCDNPPCCNPAHLFLGTHEDNMADMRLKGRSPLARNERSGKAVLTNEQVQEIRRRRIAGESCDSIASAFDVSSAHISRITRGERRPAEEGEEITLYDGPAACPQGHPWTLKNTYVRPDGTGRMCRTCARRRRKDRPGPPRKPCRRCGGPKEPGVRRIYCNGCLTAERTAGPDVIACPTPAGNCCGACQRDLCLQEQAEAAHLADLVEHGSPSDLYP